MDDLNNNEVNSENLGDKENINERKESNVEIQYSEGKENCQESEKDGKENSQDQQKILPQEQKEVVQEGEKASPSYSEASEISSKEENSAAKYSTSYSPPYYVPNFTVSTSSDSNSGAASGGNEKKKKSKKWMIPVIAVAVVASIIITGVLAIGIGHVLHNAFGGIMDGDSETESTETQESIGDETVTIIKNDGSITVDEQIGSTGYSGLSVAEITALVADSVVEISTEQKVSTFYGQYISSGAGSGVIIGHAKDTNAYYIVTNYHVIDGADSIKIRLRNGTSYGCTLMGGSALDDLALLRISANGSEKLTVATLGKSANLKVGDGVVAIGNPLGTLGGTVTDGIISALDREIMVENNVMMLLQTNAAINPGNSGGGLFNSAGELIGVVNAKQSDTGIEGLGFAIPIDRASECIDDLLEYGYVKGHASLGVKVQTVSLSSGLSSNTYVQVTSVSDNSSLEVGDVIYSVNGETVSSVATFNASIYRLKIGDTVEVQLVERNAIGQNALVTKKVKVMEYNPGDFS